MDAQVMSLAFDEDRAQYGAVMLKLSELKAARIPAVSYGGLIEGALARDWRPDLANGVLATLKAADALIEVVEAALARDEAKLEYDRGPLMAMQYDVSVANRRYIEADARYRAAVAKVVR